MLVAALLLQVALSASPGGGGGPDSVALAAARNVHATVERATTMLGGVDYGPLSNDRKKAYNDAKRFIRQAEDALKRGNFAFAQGVATKAETLARELSGK
jgi:hypothetical protein